MMRLCIDCDDGRRAGAALTRCRCDNCHRFHWCRDVPRRRLVAALLGALWCLLLAGAALALIWYAAG